MIYIPWKELNFSDFIKQAFMFKIGCRFGAYEPISFIMV